MESRDYNNEQEETSENLSRELSDDGEPGAERLSNGRQGGQIRITSHVASDELSLPLTSKKRGSRGCPEFRRK